MRPSLLAGASEGMGLVYDTITNKILVNLASHFKVGVNQGETWKYQARMLAELGQVTQETVKIIKDGVKGTDKVTYDAIESAIRDAVKDSEPRLKKAAELGLIYNKPTGLQPNQMNAFAQYYNQAKDGYNLINQTLLTSTERAYKKTVSDIVGRVELSQKVFNAETGAMIVGVSTWDTAARDAVNGMIKSGLTGLVDRAGRKWTPEAYARMVTRTTMFNAAREASTENALYFGVDTYQVSTHDGARPLCYPWQGKVISRTDNSRDIVDGDGNTIHVYAQSETTYGQPAGLFGINCGHYPIPFIPGFSSASWQEPQPKEENDKQYAESQKQRALERNVRQKKLELEAARAQGADEAELTRLNGRVRDAQAKVRAFCNETGRVREYNREQIYRAAQFPNFKEPSLSFNS